LLQNELIGDNVYIYAIVPSYSKFFDPRSSYFVNMNVVLCLDKKPSYRWGTARRGRASWNLV